MVNHAGAGARRGDHIVAVLEGANELAGDLSGFVLIAAVIGGLSAACLRFRKIYLTAVTVQQTNDALAHLGVELIRQTRNK